MKRLQCPKCSSQMELRTLQKKKSFRGVDIEYPTEAHVCVNCGLEAGTVQSAGEVQREIADAYRKRAGLLTSQEIKSLRKGKGLTQQHLAEAMNVGVASIKRWETGIIQSRSMDEYMRMILQDAHHQDSYTGNRETDLPRIKLIAKHFEKILARELLRDGDRFLFLAKYLWYADFLAFRELGRGLTGASYAALPYGPQLNNYKDLLGPILASDAQQAQPLSDGELCIIQRVAERFPKDQDVYDAAHRENIWQNSRMGALLSYSSASELTEI